MTSGAAPEVICLAQDVESGELVEENSFGQVVQAAYGQLPSTLFAKQEKSWSLVKQCFASKVNDSFCLFISHWIHRRLARCMQLGGLVSVV